MRMNSDGWFLYPGDRVARAGLVREGFELSAPAEGEVIAEPLYGAWEGNMGHAVERSPIDVCKFRREERVILGNAGVVRVLECGPNVTTLRAGDVAVIFSGSDLDEYGYPKRILGYDAPNTMGCLATRIKIKETNLIVLRNPNLEDLPRWAAFSVRYFTAWSNFALAFKIYRLMVSEAQDPAPNVWAWGGGTALAELELARRFGCRTVMLSGNDRRLETIRSSGITALDRRSFGDLSFDEQRAVEDDAYRLRYVRAEAQFLRAVDELTEGRRVQIFVDNIGTIVSRPTGRALSREGIIATAGWKEGMHIQYLRAVACIGRQQHVNTHYAQFKEGPEAVRYAEENDWLPRIDGPVYSFDDIPTLAEDFRNGNVGMFPVYRVNSIS